MTLIKHTLITLTKVTALVSLLTFSNLASSANNPALIDDFSHPEKNAYGMPRMFMNDSSAGGGTKTEQAIENGLLLIKGEISPARGQPGWASSVLPLAQMGQAMDASQYSGIKLRVKINGGNMSVSANSNDVTNFDYHAAPVMVAPDGKFHEIKIPFKAMKRAWSEQTKLNAKTLGSLSIVAFDLKKGSFDFVIDEVRFY